MKKPNYFKTIAVIFLCVFIDIALHLITSGFSSMPANPNHSRFAQFFGVEATAFLWALLAFSAAACVFNRLKSTIPGAGLAKGIRYGGSLAMLWMLGMLEGVALFGNAILNEFVVGLSDAIPVFLLSILLSLPNAQKKENYKAKRFSPGRKLGIIGIFAGVFLAGRYAAYCTGIIQSGYQSSPMYTLLWTFLTGVCIGTACIVLENPESTVSLKRGTVRFSLLIFGINWATFLIFMPLLFSGFILDVLLRIMTDIFIVIIGYCLTFRFSQQYGSITTRSYMQQ